MDKKTVLEIINRFQKAIEVQGIKVNKLILFDSYARGTQHEWSDIDLIVISEDFVGKNFWQRIDILTKAICKVYEPIEGIPFSPEEWEMGNSFFVDYAKDGEVVYAAA